MKIQDAEVWLRLFCPHYLIAGYKSDGYRGIPATYKEEFEFVIFEQDVYEQLEKFTEFRIFELQESVVKPAEWLELKKKKTRVDVEKRERELLQKLKDKYEK